MLSLLARAVGDLQDAVLITEGERGADGVRKIIFVNRAFTEMTGFSAEEAIGNLPDITIGPESDREALKKIQSARDALVPVRVELLKYRKDRSTFWAELAGTSSPHSASAKASEDTWWSRCATST